MWLQWNLTLVRGSFFLVTKSGNAFPTTLGFTGLPEAVKIIKEIGELLASIGTGNVTEGIF